MKPQLNIFQSPTDAARALAQRMYETALRYSEASRPMHVALSGGTTPALLFSILADEYVDKMPWHSLRFYWVDERCVSPTHPESNYGMTFEKLLVKVPMPESNVFRMKAETSPELEVNRYSNLLSEQLPSIHNLPQFDLILLGMGDDGHTASIFPDNMALLQSPSLVSIAKHPVSGQKRITLTGRVINNAREVIFFITGSSKAQVLKRILSDVDAAQYPAAHIHSEINEIVFFLDENIALELD